jgi:hypothetical protein
MQICTVPTVLTARRHLEAPSMPRVPINRTPSHLADMSDPWPRPIPTNRHCRWITTYKRIYGGDGGIVGVENQPQLGALIISI